MYIHIYIYTYTYYYKHVCVYIYIYIHTYMRSRATSELQGSNNLPLGSGEVLMADGDDRFAQVFERRCFSTSFSTCVLILLAISALCPWSETEITKTSPQIQEQRHLEVVVAIRAGLESSLRLGLQQCCLQLGACNPQCQCKFGGHSASDPTTIESTGKLSVTIPQSGFSKHNIVLIKDVHIYIYIFLFIYLFIYVRTYIYIYMYTYILFCCFAESIIYIHIYTYIQHSILLFNHRRPTYPGAHL